MLSLCVCVCVQGYTRCLLVCACSVLLMLSCGGLFFSVPLFVYCSCCYMCLVLRVCCFCIGVLGACGYGMFDVCVCCISIACMFFRIVIVSYFSFVSCCTLSEFGVMLLFVGMG